jgi:hypothetical protein
MVALRIVPEKGFVGLVDVFDIGQPKLLNLSFRDLQVTKLE